MTETAIAASFFFKPKRRSFSFKDPLIMSSPLPVSAALRKAADEALDDDVTGKVKLIRTPTYESVRTNPGCGNCGKRATLKCNSCKTVHYCSAECHREHWLKHKKLCKSVRKYRKIDGKKVNVSKGMMSVMNAYRAHQISRTAHGVSTMLCEPGIYELLLKENDHFFFMKISWKRFLKCLSILSPDITDEKIAIHQEVIDSGGQVFVSLVEGYRGAAISS
jgi:hypothetical protein